MYYLAQHKTLSSRTTSALIAASFVAVSPTQALANPIDDAAERIAGLPSLSAFGLGCAVGAIVGGLIIGLVGIRTKRRMSKEIDELVELVERAEAAARHAEAMASVRINTYDQQTTGDIPFTTPGASMSEVDEHTPAMSVDAMLDPVFGTPKYKAPQATANEAAATSEAADATDTATTTETVANEAAAASVSAVTESKGNATHTTVAERVPNVPAVQEQDDLGRTTLMEEPYGKQADSVSTNNTSEQKGKKKLTETLHDALDTTDAFDIPVISRGQAVEGSGPIFTHTSRIRQVNPAVRARIIEKRIPRFDESLFPDLESEQHTSVDIFETAMRAMEDSLSAVSISAADMGTQPEFSFVPPEGHPEINDPKAYIEYLIQDEMERNRSGSARRYSRAHLTMIEGTGDLSDVRSMRPRRPRHMRVASKEA